MESLEKQDITLSHKVDALYQAIEQLDRKVSAALSDRVDPTSETTERIGQGRYLIPSQLSFSSRMEHKDILPDGNYFDANPQTGEKLMTPEIQIQRLTAQLTAAYNRIATLEEQLLRYRDH